MKQLTKADWEAGLKKWERNGDHRSSCSFCNLYNDGWGPNAHCVTSGCPLADLTKPGADICCSGKWIEWRHLKTEENALAVHDFIATKYIEWLSKHEECGSDKPKWVRYAGDCFSYITRNKWYKITRHPTNTAFEIIVDNGEAAYCLYKGCGHILNGDWELCYDDTPPEVKCDKCGQVIKETE